MNRTAAELIRDLESTRDETLGFFALGEEELSRTYGRSRISTPKIAPSSSLQAWASRSNNWLRAAFEASQTCLRPPVRQ